MLAFQSVVPTVQAGQTVTVFVERTLGGYGVYTFATVIVVYSATKRVERSVLFKVAKLGASVAGGATLLERLDDGEVRPAGKELSASEFMVERGVAAASELLIGGLDEVIGAEDVGDGGVRDDNPDDEIYSVALGRTGGLSSDTVTTGV